METRIVGQNNPAILARLAPGERIEAQSGAMLFMDDGIEMDTERKGGLMGSVKRRAAGESAFITHFTGVGPGGWVGLAAPFPGTIREIDLQPGLAVMAERGSFLAATSDVEITVAFSKKLGAGFLGGEGFVLQRLIGEGKTWLHAGGDPVDFTLAPGQRLKVDTGCLVWFDESVTYELVRTGGLKKSLFSGEGLFLAQLTGPGRVCLQTMPFGKLSTSIVAAGGGAQSSSSGGNLLGNIIGGGD